MLVQGANLPITAVDSAPSIAEKPFVTIDAQGALSLSFSLSLIHSLSLSLSLSSLSAFSSSP